MKQTPSVSSSPSLLWYRLPFPPRLRPFGSRPLLDSDRSDPPFLILFRSVYQNLTEGACSIPMDRGIEQRVSVRFNRTEHRGKKGQEPGGPVLVLREREGDSAREAVDGKGREGEPEAKERPGPTVRCRRGQEEPVLGAVPREEPVPTEEGESMPTGGESRCRRGRRESVSKDEGESVPTGKGSPRESVPEGKGRAGLEG